MVALTDVNKFDTFLKTDLRRDIFFRTVVGGLIAAVTIAHMELFGKDVLVALVSFLEKMAPILNIVGTLLFFLAVVGIGLKDLEHHYQNPAFSGMVGGFVRRVGGDGTLFILGSFATAIFMFAYATTTKAKSGGDYALGITAITALTIMFALTAIANILVRRGSPSPLVLTDSPKNIFNRSGPAAAAFYISIILLAVINIHYDLIAAVFTIIARAFQ